MTYLIVSIEGLQIAGLNKPPYFVITQANSIVEIAEPDNRIVVFDRAITLEAETMIDGSEVTIPLFVIGEASGKMSSYQADPSVGVI